MQCLCNTEYNSLPRYSEAWENRGLSAAVSCGCRYQTSTNNQNLQADSGRLYLHTIDSFSSAEDTETAMTQSHRRRTSEPALGATTLYERLVTGQESEIGEAPPPYRIATQSRV
jgi:arrestin-related trafficking adapter 3/6